MIKYISILLIIALVATPAFAAVNNLDEAVARKTRMATATYSNTFLENSSNNYFWQSETLNYTDSASNNEVWQFTNSPNKFNQSQDISITHWSANGNRMIFQSNRVTGAFSLCDNNTFWYLSNTDGSRLRPAINAASRTSQFDKYPLWSPILADVLWQGGTGGYDCQSTAANSLYKVDVTDTGASRTAYLTFNTGITRTELKKAISGDGRKILVHDVARGKFLPVTVYPEASKASDTVDGYGEQLGFDYYWGAALSGSWASYHDQFVAGAVNGADGVWSYLMPESTSGSWWRNRLTGTGTDSAPIILTDHTAPYNWGGELEPINSPPSGRNPWCPQGTVAGTDCMSYFSHFAPDRWGRYGISTKSVDSPEGTSIADLRNHTFKVTAFTANQIGGIGGKWTQHHDWSAWSDWSVSSAYPNTTDYLNGAIAIQNFKDSGSQKVIAATLTRYNSGGAADGGYTQLARPFQSPDGTKVAFNSTFLNASDSYPQMFWSVAYYPYPPEIKSAAKNGGNVRLTWDFNQGTAGSPNLVNPRTYATRGWPHETTDRPPSPREIKQFRVWVSSDNSTWSPVGTANYNNCSGTNECGMWTETAWTYDATQANSTTRYYAVTSLEHSGLESRTLSNTWKVILDGSGNVSSQVQESSYPADPGGKVAFYTTAPDVPTGVTKTHQKSPATVAGQYTVEWTAPTNKTLIRHYNIYAKDGSTPTAIQQNRIASVPATAADTAFSYVDWMGKPDGTTEYFVTSVDYFGNEAGVATPDSIKPVTTPNKSGRFQTSQTVTLSANETATTQYCRSTSTDCTPSTSYSAPVKVLVNIPYEKICYRSTDSASNVETAKCTIYEKKRRK